MQERQGIKIPGAKKVTQRTYQETGSVIVTVLPRTERPGYAVVKVRGSRDDDFGQGEYHYESVIEVHETRDLAKKRADELNATDAFQTENRSAGDETCVYEYMHFTTGEVVLRLCMLADEQGA